MKHILTALMLLPLSSFAMHPDYTDFFAGVRDKATQLDEAIVTTVTEPRTAAACSPIDPEDASNDTNKLKDFAINVMLLRKQLAPRGSTKEPHFNKEIKHQLSTVNPNDVREYSYTVAYFLRKTQSDDVVAIEYSLTLDESNQSIKDTMKVRGRYSHVLKFDQDDCPVTLMFNKEPITLEFETTRQNE